jgi:hypothetical protein
MKGIEGAFDIVGGQAALAYFATLDPSRLSHGYIFSGPVGVGKKTFARRIAQSLLCETPKGTLLGYCGTCPGCTLFVAGTHPDFVSSEGRIKIGGDGGSALHDEDLSARDLVRELSLHGYRSRYRVVLLGDVSFATHEAANALLKFFEEPPSGVVVILTTSAPGSLLATIRSRFIELAFGPLPRADVERVLLASGVTPERAAFASEIALGSIARARAILDEDDLGVRDASYAWFARAVRGEPADASFLRLDDRSLSGRRETRARRRTDRARARGRARLGRAQRRRRRRSTSCRRSEAALREASTARPEGDGRTPRGRRRRRTPRRDQRLGRTRGRLPTRATRAVAALAPMRRGSLSGVPKGAASLLWPLRCRAIPPVRAWPRTRT